MAKMKLSRNLVTAVVGANWGDEGKGKITDALASGFGFVVRFQGGNNAGHTVINGYGKFALHLVPSGVFHAGVTNVLGPGVAVNVAALLAEIDGLVSRGVPKPSVLVSDRAEVVAPYHIFLDELEEKRLGPKSFGSTRSGIAPFYADKYLKLGVQVADLFDGERLRARVAAALEAKNVLLKHLYNAEPFDADAVTQTLARDGRRIEPLVCDTVAVLRDALAQGKRILLEGQLGTLRDPDHGIYPFPTSSSPLAGFASVGAGVPPYEISRIVAVTKAYSSCVGAGPFVTELSGAAADQLRARGGSAGEYGATTGRPRRVGWFDAVATRYGALIQGATEMAVTNLDVLGYLDEIPICTRYEIDGVATDRFPLPRALDRAKPIFETMPGWKSDISAARQWSELPKPAKAYVSRMEDLVGVPVRYISTGPHREDLIDRH
jgi:adenylosuccinate synthase